ncbi:MAG: hypothetical protein IAF02_14690 [Anaerolineae bacterium]|nr:hypothetical protein [Anaerolineae bacterium]
MTKRLRKTRTPKPLNKVQLNQLLEVAYSAIQERAAHADLPEKDAAYLRTIVPLLFDTVRALNDSWDQPNVREQTKALRKSKREYADV